MIEPRFDRIPDTEYALEGHVADYMTAVSDNWLKIAPYANPGMLEMFRDRDRKPYRNMMRWAGWFASMYLIGAVQVLRVTSEAALRQHLEWFVSELLSLQAKDGYLGPWPKDYRLKNRAPNVHHPEDGISWDTSAHYYMMLGLWLWYEETGDCAVLDSIKAMADAICDIYLGKPAIRMVDTGHTEMNLAPSHVFALLFHKTKIPRYIPSWPWLSYTISSETNVTGRPLSTIGGVSSKPTVTTMEASRVASKPPEVPTAKALLKAAVLSPGSPTVSRCCA
jgi:hypothetical protein